MLTLMMDDPSILTWGECRRASRRYEPVRREACLAWWGDRSDAGDPFDLDRTILLGDAEPEPRYNFALLLDISLAGASIAIDRLPQEGQAVWLRLEADTPTEWSEATIVEITSTHRGPYLVRLAFRSPCPIETIRTAVWG